LQRNLYSVIQGAKVDKDVLASLHGADERAIVYSGLEEIMCSTIKENWELAKHFDFNLRTAAINTAIN
jgi:hypothetical protein